MQILAEELENRMCEYTQKGCQSASPERVCHEMPGSSDTTHN